MTELDYDALIIGGGIGGIQTAIDLGDMGHKVLMIERRVSTGGAMIQLSKVFPTLDCGSCITTPKMSSAFNHAMVTTKTMAEFQSFTEQSDDTFEVEILQRSRFVDLDACSGCNECADACPVIVLDEGYDESLGYTKAVGVPFATALPQKAALDIDNCIYCGKCANVCPTDAIHFEMRDEIQKFKVGAIIIATGFYQTPIKENYGGGRFKNVITGLQMERLLSPTGPTLGIFRPSDSKIPWSIAFVQCAGSRDKSIGVPYCSSICCMFAIKQAILASASAVMAEITIYNIDIRAFGKGYDVFYETARNMGINFVKGKVALIEELENKDTRLHIEVLGRDGNKKLVEHDLTVLSMGVVPQWDEHMSKELPVALNSNKFVDEIRLLSDPGITSIPGVFAVGTATGPKDIVDTIVSGSAIAGKVSLWLKGELRDRFLMKELQVVM